MFRPMLSAECSSVDLIKFPVLVSPKLDGIRCVIRSGRALTRTLKAVPNAYISAVLSSSGVAAFDGELIVGSPVDPLVWNNSQSGVMSRDGNPDFVYHVFDRVDAPDSPFEKRYASLKSLIDALPSSIRHHFVLVPHYKVNSLKELMSYEEMFVAGGYEGIMIRSLDGKYKYGRSTEKEGGLLKLKRFYTVEVRIKGYKERLHNTNEKVKDERGLSKRSSHKANKIPMGTLGALVCEAPRSLFDKEDTSGEDVEFDIGTGFDDATRQHIWDNRPHFLGAHALIKYQELTVTGAPRFGVYLGIRSELDIVIPENSTEEVDYGFMRAGDAV